MLKTWEKTCSGASIIVPNLDFSRWTGPSGRLFRAGVALRAVWPASGPASAASSGGGGPAAQAAEARRWRCRCSWSASELTMMAYPSRFTCWRACPTL